MKGLLLVALASQLAITSTISAQSTTLAAQVDRARLQAGVDSFTVLMRGTPMGWQKLTRVRGPKDAGWEMRDGISLGGMIDQESVIALDEALAERSLRQRGIMRGTPMRIALDFMPVAGGTRATGQSETPSNPGKVLTIDTVLSAGTVDDNTVTPLLAAVQWREGLDVRVPVLSSGKGTVSEYRLRVLQADTVTVPAGHFDVWRIEQQAERSVVTLFVTRAAPYRLVRMQQNGTPLDIVLVSTRRDQR